MKSHTKDCVRRGCIVIGCGLISCSVIMLVCRQVLIYVSVEKATQYVSILRTLMPDPEPAVPEKQINDCMPVLSVDGIDFIGILEYPQYNSCLPVCAKWGETDFFPCRYTGSVYDGTMIVRSTNQKGQYPFAQDINISDFFYFTDMVGNQYSYRVSEILHRNHADKEILYDNDADLVLFIKNNYAFEYTIIYMSTITFAKEVVE